MSLDNKLIPIPIWALKTKVEGDFQEYMFLHDFESGELEEGEELLGKPSKFPEYDSTSAILEALEKEGIIFDTKTGLWKE